MALTLSEALNSYGPAGMIASAIPELKAVFDQAAREEWPSAKFDLAIQGTTWWKTHGDSAREYITLRIADPAEYNARLANARTKITLSSMQMGLGRIPTDRLNSLALLALTSGWDDQQLRYYLARDYKPITPGGAYTGDAADIQTQLQQLASAFGVPVTKAFLAAQLRTIQMGDNSVEGFEALMRARAKATYAHFADQLDAGMTVRDIADPYVSTMANTLEMSESDIDLNDPWIKKALTQRTDGTSNAMPLWQFERQLKEDPRWDKTKQARDQAFETIRQIGRDFGMAS